MPENPYQSPEAEGRRRKKRTLRTVPYVDVRGWRGLAIFAVGLSAFVVLVLNIVSRFN